MNDNIEDIYPLTPLQQGMLFHSLRMPEHHLYVDCMRFGIQGPIAEDAFRQAWKMIVAQHAVLRTAFAWEGLEQPLQIVQKAMELPLECLDWRHYAEADLNAQLSTLETQLRDTPFALNRPPLMRIRLVRTDDDKYQLVWAIHHMLVDGWSASKLLTELFVTYCSLEQGVEPSLPTPRPYKEYVRWLRQQDPHQAEAYWRSSLDGWTTPTLLPSMHHDASSGSLGDAPRFSKRSITVQGDITPQLRAFASGNRLTLNTIVQGAWALMLRAYAGGDDIVFGSVVSGRPPSLRGAESMIGMFINTIPVRVQIPPPVSTTDWLATIQANQVAGRQFEHSPLVDIQGWSQVARDTPLFESILVFENQGSGSDSFRPHSDLEITRGEHHASTTGYPITVVVEPLEEMVVSIFYDLQRFDRTHIDNLLTQFVTVLQEVLRNPSVGEISLLSTDEQAQLRARWNETDTDYPCQTVHELFEQCAQESPDRIAIVTPEQQLTYGQLNARANQIAHWLLESQLRPGDLVGICVQDSLDLVIGSLGTFKAGCAYVPLDPAYPQERLSFMLQDAGAAVLISDSEPLSELHGSDMRVLHPQRDQALLDAHPTTSPQRPATPSQVAYVMYTSGSTGWPKGTAVPHHAIVRLVRDTNYVNFVHNDNVAQISNHSFDAATFELWGSLLNGARLVAIPKNTALSSSELAAFLRERYIDKMFLTSALFDQVAEHDASAFSNMDLLMVGGQALTPRWVRRVLEEAPPRRIVNGYGPTETTTFAATHEIREVAQGATSIPIGMPISNTSLHVLDREMNVMPLEVHGELCIGGDGLAHGYHGRPELTAEKFIPNACSSQPGTRLYRTGDEVFRRRDGAIEFVGRYDNQIKLRGFRIELGEIEMALLGHPSVGHAVVVAQRESDSSQDVRLVAYYTSEESLSVKQLRDHLKTTLPDYMVPAAFIQLDSVPLTPNGKVDVRALPDAPESDVNNGEIRTANTPVAEIVGGIWAAILKVDRVGPEDSFFDLGGHSLLATQVVSRTSDAFKVSVTLRDLFESANLKQFAERVEEQIRSSHSIEAIPLRRLPETDDMPLSFAQQRLWFVDQVDPGNPSYNIFTAVRLKGGLDVGALQESLNQIVLRHEALRTTFGARDGQAIQRIAQTLTIDLSVVEVSGSSASERETNVRQSISRESAQPFRLDEGPLIRASLYRLADDDHVVALTLHHIVGDEWSLGIMVNELATAYQALAAKESPTLPELPIQYSDFARWQRDWLKAGNLDKQLAYWRKQLGGDLPVIKLPTDRPHPTDPTFAGAIDSFQVDQSVSQKLNALCRQEGVTMFMACLAMLQAQLRSMTGLDDVIVGTDVANRNRLETEGLIGFFVNHLVLRSNLEGNPPFRELLQRVRKVTLDAYLNQDVPFDRLVAAIQPDRKAHHTPLFQVLFVFGNPSSPKLEVPGLTFSPMGADDVRAKYDLTLFIHQGEDRVSGAWRYRNEIFDASTVKRIADGFLEMMRQVVEDPAIRLDRIELNPTATDVASRGRTKSLRGRSRQSVEFQT